MNNNLPVDKPIPESYWVIPGVFLAGCYPGSTRGDDSLTRQMLRTFLKAGFTSFFDLTQPEEIISYRRILVEQASLIGETANYQRFPIPDFGLPEPPSMNKILVALDNSISAGKKVYLHCWGGIGRTGTVVGCWLVKHGRSGADALEHLAKLFQTSSQSGIYSRSPEVDEQVQFILDWEKNGLA